MKTTYFITNLQSRVITIFMVITLNGYAQSKPVIAYVGNECSDFFDGIATTEDSSDSYFFINRKGEKVGTAPGKMINSDSHCRIFENRKGYILTDKNNQIIVNSKDEIQAVFDGMYYISPIGGSGKLINFKGETLKEYESLPSFYTHNGSSEMIVNYFTESKEKENEYEFFYDLFHNGEYVITTRGILREYLAYNYPFVFYYTYNPKTKKCDKINAYIKSNNKCIDLSKSLISYIPGTNYFINFDLKAHVPEDYIYFDRHGEIIPFEVVSTNSLGNKIIYDKSKKHYRFVNKHGEYLSSVQIQDVDPYLWQSGVIAAKVNNKWGYFDQTGKVFLPFEYTCAGPRIGNVCAVVKGNEFQFLCFDENDSLVSIPVKDIRKSGRWLHYYFTDNIEGNNVLIWRREGGDYRTENPVYGFYNLDTYKGVDNLGTFPQFEDEIAISYYRNSTGTDDIGCILSLDGEIKAHTQAGNFMNYLGEDLYYYNDFDTKSFKVITYIYSKAGELLYNSKSSGLKLEGKFSNGVAPISLEGGLNNNGQHYYSGYIYNTFSSNLEDVLMNYGDMGQDELASEMNDKIKGRIELLDYYQILGNKALERCDYQRAIHYFDKALELNSIHDQSNFGKGLAYISLGNYTKALQYLRYILGDLDGVEYAKALCYYNLGNYDKAEYYNNKVASSDPSYNQSSDLKILINEALEVQHKEQDGQNISGWDKALAILGIISNGLQLFSQSMQAVQPPQQQYNPTPTYNYNSGNTNTRRTCKSCNGTGLSSTKERAAFYNYNEETYSNSPCEVCGDRDSHYHKPCPHCMGKGYTNY